MISGGKKKNLKKEGRVMEAAGPHCPVPSPIRRN